MAREVEMHGSGKQGEDNEIMQGVGYNDFNSLIQGHIKSNLQLFSRDKNHIWINFNNKMSGGPALLPTFHKSLPMSAHVRLNVAS